MELYTREFFISRIRAGYISFLLNKYRIVVKAPSNDILVQANELYINEYYKALEEDLLTTDDTLFLLIQLGLWTEQNENEYQNIVPKHIDYWKVELYNSLLRSKTKEQVKKYLDAAKKELIRLAEIRHSYDYLTAEGYAAYVKNMFLVSKCAEYNNKRINWRKFDISQIMYNYHSHLLSSDQIRFLARTTPWASLWPVLKLNGQIFENINLTTEQQVLLSWSVMFDRIFESPDCPSDEVIEDDDMLDGWLIIQRKKREEERNKQEVEDSVNKKIRNADEIFVKAESLEDAKKIELLNSPQSKKIKQQRLNQLKSNKVVRQQEFRDVQQKRSMLMAQAYNSIQRR